MVIFRILFGIWPFFNGTAGRRITQNGQNFSYTYDDVGNIVREVHNGKNTTYVYDSLGQLIRYNDEQAGKSWVFTYDRGGNLTGHKQYAYTEGTLGEVELYEDFQYGNANWKDQMTRRIYNGYYNYDMTYDAIGNLTSYAGWTYTWAEGRRLVKQVQDSKTVTYAYDASGLRVKKTYNSTVYDYTWSGDRLVHLRAGSNDLHFFYDEAGTPSMMLFNNVPYRYVKNLQGDIIAIVDTSGTTVVEYKYDPWGKKESRTGSLSGTVGYYNPFRYRGYIFDEETWMYYLKDRYYYPELRRFINADRLTGCIGVSISHNLFAYCINSPTMYKDPWGLAPAELTAFPEVPKDIANIMEQAGYSIPDFPAQFQGVSPINYQEVSKGFITVEFSQTTYEDTIFGPQVHYRTYQYVIDVDQNRSLEKTYNKWFKNAATDSMIDALSSISMDGIALVHMICPPIAAQWDTIMFVVGAVKTALDEVMDESVYQPFSATIFHRIVPKYLREYTYREIIN